jgi:hypothetical protein
LQRSIRIDNYAEVAENGAGRGENLYFLSAGCATTNTLKRDRI